MSIVVKDMTKEKQFVDMLQLCKGQTFFLVEVQQKSKKQAHSCMKIYWKQLTLKSKIKFGINLTQCYDPAILLIDK